MIKTITAADAILALINIDLANRPTFTMTHAQLRNRIYDYCDDSPNFNDDDINAIYNLLCPLIRCFRD